MNQIYLRSPAGQQVPLSAFARFAPDVASLSITHQGLFPAATISFNFSEGVALGDAVDKIHAEAAKVGLPGSIQTVFAGTAQAYQDSLSNEPVLIAAALATVYLVLGILYESYIHPITILSTLPSAGVGALLRFILTKTDLSIIAIIGIILLIGIVKKNAILMIDFAIAAERDGQNLARFDLRSLHAAFSPHPDDHDGRSVGRSSARAGPRNRIGIAPAARHHDHRRADRQPDADVVHDAGGVSLLRSIACVVGRRPFTTLAEIAGYRIGTGAVGVGQHESHCSYQRYYSGSRVCS